MTKRILGVLSVLFIWTSIQARIDGTIIWCENQTGHTVFVKDKVTNRVVQLDPKEKKEIGAILRLRDLNESLFRKAENIKREWNIDVNGKDIGLAVFHTDGWLLYGAGKKGEPIKMMKLDRGFPLKLDNISNPDIFKVGDHSIEVNWTTDWYNDILFKIKPIVKK